MKLPVAIPALEEADPVGATAQTPTTAPRRGRPITPFSVMLTTAT